LLAAEAIVIRRWVLPMFSVLCLFCSSAQAESRVVVRSFYGPGADTLRRDVIKILSRHREIEVVPSDRADAVAKKLGVDASSPEGRLAVAEELKIAAWLEAIIQKQGGELRATVLLYDGKTHDRIGRYVATRRNAGQLASALNAELWRKLRDPLLTAAAPVNGAVSSRSTEEPSSTDSESSDSGSEEEEVHSATPASAASTGPTTSVPAPSMALGSASTVASARWFVTAAGAAATPAVAAAAVATPPSDLPNFLVLTAEVGTLTRKLDYEDPLTLSLGPYSLPVAPQAGLAVRYFPGAHLTAGWASNFGLDANARFAFATKSEATDGTVYKARVDSYGAGLRLRIPLKAHEVSLLGGYGIERFAFDESKAKPAPTPNVDYRFVRMGGEGEFAVSDKFSLGARAAFLWLLSVGEIGTDTWFPRISGNAFESTAFAAFALSPKLDLMLSAGLTHYFFDFGAKAGDPLVAGGATDDYITVSLGLRVSL
jgi:hypothetical protein